MHGLQHHIFGAYKGLVSKFRNLVIILDFWPHCFCIFQKFVKRFCQGISDNFVEKRSDGIQYHRVWWYSMPSKFLFHKKCYILFSKHYFDTFCAKIFPWYWIPSVIFCTKMSKITHQNFSQIFEKWKNNTAKKSGIMTKFRNFEIIYISFNITILVGNWCNIRI